MNEPERPVIRKKSGNKITTILIFLLIPVLIAGAVYAFVWYSVVKSIDSYLASIGSVFEVHYENFSVSPFGEIQAEEVLITPLKLPKTIRIETLRIKAKHILALLEINAFLEGGDLPLALNVVMQNIHFEPDDRLLSLFGWYPAGDDLFANLRAKGCGPVTWFGPEEFAAMGYRNPLGQLTLSYRHHDDNFLLTLEANAEIENMLSVSAIFYFPVYSNFLSRLDAQRALASLLNADITITDESLNERIAKFCAEKTGQSVENYRKRHVALLVEHFKKNGFSPGSNLIGAYQEYISGPNRLYLNFNPDSAINLRKLAYYDTDNYAELLGLSLFYNDEPVPDPAFRISGPPPSEVARIRELEARQQNKSTLPDHLIPRVRDRKYRPTPLDHVPSFIGRPALVRTTAGKEYKGKLLGFHENRLQLYIRIRMGNVVFTFAEEEITDFEVYY